MGHYEHKRAGYTLAYTMQGGLGTPSPRLYELEILGNPASGIEDSRKPSFRRYRFSEIQEAEDTSGGLRS